MPKVSVHGLSDLTSDFQALERAERGPALKAATRAGAKIAQQAIKARAPKRLGKMARGIVVGNERARKPSEQATATVTLSKRTYMYEGQRKSAAMVGRMVELGTKNQAAAPFFRPAFDGVEDEVGGAVEGALLTEIDKVLVGRR